MGLEEDAEMPIEEFVSTDHQERDGDTTPGERRRRDEKLSVWRRDESRAPRRWRVCRSAAMISSRHALPRQHPLPRLPHILTDAEAVDMAMEKFEGTQDNDTFTRGAGCETQTPNPRPRWTRRLQHLAGARRGYEGEGREG